MTFNKWCKKRGISGDTKKRLLSRILSDYNIEPSEIDNLPDKIYYDTWVDHIDMSGEM